MPLPHISTLHLANTGGVRLSPIAPTLAELGRLHLTSHDLRDIRLEEKRKLRHMAFGIVKKSELPVTGVGKAAPTKPYVGITFQGRMLMNGFINKAWNKEVDRVVLLFDPTTNMVAVVGLKPGEKFPMKGYDEKDAFSPAIGKANKDGKGGGDYSLAASGFLKLSTQYDFVAAGNQTFEALPIQSVKGFEKLTSTGYVFTLPKETPTPKPVIKRAKKAVASTPAAPAVNPTNGTPVDTSAPDDDELVLG